jgi:DNA-binding transcriptional MocR family regulator
VAPGQIFSTTCNYSSCVRIGYGKPWDADIDYGLMMLGKLVKKMLA